MDQHGTSTPNAATAADPTGGKPPASADATDKEKVAAHQIEDGIAANVPGERKKVLKE